MPRPVANLCAWFVQVKTRDHGFDHVVNAITAAQAIRIAKASMAIGYRTLANATDAEVEARYPKEWRANRNGAKAIKIEEIL